MIDFENIYNSLDDVGAELCVICMDLLDTATIEQEGEYMIFLNPACCPTLSEMKTRLMHEYGHCATGATHAVSSPFEIVGKNEHKANRCSYEKFLPWEEIKKAAHNGRAEYWQLAEYFDISEQYIRNAVKYYKENKGYTF